MLLSSFGSLVAGNVPGDFVIDEVKAVVEGPARIDAILDSDVKRRSFDGTLHTLDDLVLECAKDQRGDKLGITIDKDDVDRYLHTMAHGQDVSRETLAVQAKSFGYDSLDEFYEDLKRLYRANSATEAEVHTMLSTSEQEVRAYVNAHPQYQEGIFYLQTALVPYDGDYDDIKQALEDGSYNGDIIWSEPFDVLYSQLAADKQFVRDMSIDQVKAIETNQGWQLYRLKKDVKPRQLTFDERRKDVINKLREDKFNDALEKYNSDVLQDIIVTRF